MWAERIVNVSATPTATASADTSAFVSVSAAELRRFVAAKQSTKIVAAAIGNFSLAVKETERHLAFHFHST